MTSGRFRNNPGRFTPGLLVGLVGAFLFFFWVPPSAGAQDYRLEVRIILASNSDRGFDPRLLDLKTDLLALNYISFELLDTVGLSLKPGEKGTVEIPGGRVLELTPTQFRQRKIGITAGLVEKEHSLLKTTFRIENHGTVFLGGPAYEAGFLVLAVTASF